MYEISALSDTAQGNKFSFSKVSYFNSQRRLVSKIPSYVQAQAGAKIKLICTDVDGTLLNSKQQLTDGVAQAIQDAYNLGVPVCPPPFAPSTARMFRPPWPCVGDGECCSYPSLPVRIVCTCRTFGTVS